MLLCLKLDSNYPLPVFFNWTAIVFEKVVLIGRWTESFLCFTSFWSPCLDHTHLSASEWLHHCVCLHFPCSAPSGSLGVFLCLHCPLCLFLSNLRTSALFLSQFVLCFLAIFPPLLCLSLNCWSTCINKRFYGMFFKTLQLTKQKHNHREFGKIRNISRFPFVEQIHKKIWRLC